MSKTNKISNLLDRITDYTPSLFQPVNIELDQITPCLIHRESGEIYSTEYSPLAETDLNRYGRLHGWNKFNWKIFLKEEYYEVYKLNLKNDDRIQGIICLEPKDMWVEVPLVNSAPWNIGSDTQEFIGVGPHLFAIACKRSFELGFDGYTSFVSKTNLIEHYIKVLHAEVIGRSKLLIGPKAAKELVDHYFD